MLDELLGRAPLRERIAELEAERDRLERQLAAETERRADAVTARQDAQERVNRLEDRIAQLEGELDRRDDLVDERRPRRTEVLRGRRLDAVLDRLDSFETGPEGALTASIDEEIPTAVTECIGDRVDVLSRVSPCLLVTDDAGLVCAALDPPLSPEPFATWSDGFALEREWFVPTGRYAIALVRADVFALGEYDAEGDGGDETERVAFTGFETDVKSKHSKGGFSQARFERRRDEQIAEHLDRCHEAIDERQFERLYLLGDRRAIDALDVDAVATAAVDASGDPEDALDAAIRSFSTTRLYAL